MRDVKMRSVLVVAVAGMGYLLSSCTESSLTAPPDVGRPRFSMDCTLGINSCNQIDAAITRLTNHMNPACVDVGNNARLRYDAPAYTGYGFAPGNQTQAGTADAYVLMDEYPFGGYYSGWGPRDNHTYMMASVMSASDSDMQALIAHEEYHHSGQDGPGDFTGRSPGIQGICH